MPPTHSSLADVAAAYRILIAHETEPKEQDFYRTRLQRLEQATEPECEFDCRNRVAAAGVGVYCPQCSAKCADTDLTTQLAKAIRAAWVDRLDWDELAQGALEFLTSTGRLLAADGLVLAGAEKAALERLLAAQTGIVSRDVYEAIECLRALFPATEPAEDLRVHNHTPYRGPGPDGHCAERTENGRLRGQCMTEIARTVGRCPKELEGDIESFPCVLSAGHRERCKSAGGLTWGYFTPAEPTEEETKAERGPEWFREIADAVDEIEKIPGMYHSMTLRSWAGVFRNHADTLDLASSPVVPAPTETEWKRIEDVPVGVPFKDREGSGLVKLADGQFGYVDNYRETSKTLAEFAPFVAAEEG